jgi:tRNA threonylcarbamoyladenosine biosynthesis protein TsaE
MNEETFITNSEKQTAKLGYRFAERLKPGDIVALYGNLGSGKTEFIKGVCQYFEVEEMVTSPTFTIINQYTGMKGEEEIPIYHVDLYRIKDRKDLEEIGFRDCILSNNAIKLVEWAEKANGDFPDSSYLISIDYDPVDENKRKFLIKYN